MLSSDQGSSPLKKKFLSADSIILAIACVALLTSVFLIFEDGYLFSNSETSNLEPVGKFSESRNDVRRRISSGLAWAPVETSETVYEGDSIFTGDESIATVDLNQGGQLVIDPKSLIVVRTGGQGLEVDLQYGSLLGRVNKTSPIILSQNGKRQELRGQNAEVRILKSADDKTTRLQVVKGEIQFDQRLNDASQGTSGTQKTIKENEVLEISSQGAPVVKKITVRALAPASGKTVWLPVDQSLRFHWAADHAEKNAALKLELSRESNFENLIFSADVGTDGAKNHYDLAHSQRPSGPFYWRLNPGTQSSDSSELPSIPSLLTVYPDIAPTPVFPTHEQVFALQDLSQDDDAHPSSDKKQIQLSWKDEAGSIEYQIQIARDEEFKDVVHSRRLNNQVETTPDLPVGTYHWIVSGHHPQRANAPWSIKQSFTIAPAATAPDVPRLAESELHYVIPERELNRFPASLAASGRGVSVPDLPAFAWEPIEGATGYEVEVSLTEDFEKSARQPLGEQTQFKPQEIRPGPVFVRVRAIGESNLISEPSETGRLDVSIPAPRLNPIPKKLLKVDTPEGLDSASHEFALSWTPQPFAQSYEVQWGSDREFTRSKTFVTQTPERVISVTQPMDYTVRVRSLTSDGQPMSPYSETKVASFQKELIVAAAPPAPAPPTPAPAPVVTPEPEREPSSSRLTPPVISPKLFEPSPRSSVISLKGSPVYVKFRWYPIKGSNHYVLQVAQDPSFTNVLTDIRVEENEFVLEKELPEGRLYWRVKAFSGTQESAWSDASDLYVKHN